MNRSRHTPEVRADELLRAIARHQHDTRSEPRPDPEVEPGDAELAQRISGAVLATLPASKTRVIQPKRRLPMHVAGWAAALTLSFALALLLGRGPPEMLPAYRLEAAGFDQPTRSAHLQGPQSRRSITIGNRLTLILRPSRSVTTPVLGEVWRVNGREAARLPTPVATSAQGSVFLDAVIGEELILPAGRHRLWLIVRVDRAEVPLRRLVERSSSFAAPGIQAVAVEIEVVPTRDDSP